MNENYIKDFLLNNYEKIGNLACAKELGIHKSKTFSMARKLGLQISKETLTKIKTKALRKIEKTKILFDQFSSIDTPEKAYLLGYFWADGHVGKHTVSLTIAEEDMNEVKDVLLKTGNWTLKKAKKSKLSKKEMSILYKCGVALVELFESMGFKDKSQTCISSVLRFIPSDLQPYWFRGYFDGDGCVYFNPKNFRSSVQIASTKNQNWSGFINFMNELGIKPNIFFPKASFKYKGKVRPASYTLMSFCGTQSLEKFFNYIYNDNLELFGLKRKYNKFVTLFTRPYKKHTKKTSYVSNPERYSYWP